MKQPYTRYLSSWSRLVALSLLLLVGVLASLGLASSTAHAQPAATLTVTDCSGQTGPGRIGTVISSASAGDTITFSCSGTIPISSTLTISKNLTLDGSGQSVTLNGGNSVEVLFVNSGVSFTLNALAITNGKGGGGGGMTNDGGTVSISNSTFANNSAADGGGGINNFFNSTMSISNSTVFNNRASAAGGIFNDDATLSISNSTIANNSLTAGSTGAGGIWNINSAGTVNITQSIVANNSGGNCRQKVNSQGYNLESGTDCSFTGTGDLQNSDPKLASALASNGGPTQTLALLAGSPAIDHIPAARCPATDQRGVTRPDNGETTCDIGAYEFVDPPPDNDLGLTNVPANITTNATSPQGAVVTYTPPTATDESGDTTTASVSCTPASGSTFPIGLTTVTCTATDSDDGNSPVSKTFTVTVNDTDLGLTNLPANLTVNATSPQGATVTYTSPTVVDEDSPLPPVNCTPASGSTFAIGTTTVTCTASDSDDMPSAVSQSFTVTVKGAAAQVNDLISLVNSFNLPPDFQASFDTQLQAVQADLAANNTAQACRDLTAFINHAHAQSSKGLTVSQANQLIAAAKQIQAVLGC